MKKSLVILLVFYTTFICAQNKNQYLKIWLDSTETDSSRVLAYDQYAFKRTGLTADSLFIIGSEIVNFSRSKSFKTGEAIGLMWQGSSKRNVGNYKEALGLYFSAQKILEASNYKKGLGDLFGNMGIVYAYQGDYLRASQVWEQSIAFAEEIGNSIAMAYTLSNMGFIYNNLKSYSKALSYYNRAIKIGEELSHKGIIANCVSNAGLIYKEKGDVDKALEYYELGLKLYTELGDKKFISLNLINIAEIYGEREDYAKAFILFDRGLKISEEFGDKRMISGNLAFSGLLYEKQGFYSKSISNCRRGLDISTEIGEMEVQKNCLQCLYQSYKALKNNDEAILYLEELKIIEDSLKSDEAIQKLQRIDFDKQVLKDSIATVEKERLLLEVHQEEVRKKNQTRNYLIGGGLFFFLLAGAVYSRLRYVRKSKAIIEEEKDRSNNLLLNILPADIAEELKIHGKAEAREFDMVSILFTDFKGFTEASAKMSAGDLVSEINTCFEAFDGIMAAYGIEKIKTIGDSYMAAGGLPVPTDNSVKNTVLATLEMQAFITKRKVEKEAVGQSAFEMRCGIHTGPVVAGIVGVKKFQYDIWGDTVNTASRMESAGEVGKVNISQATYELLKDDADFTFESRGKIEAKGKGAVEMLFVTLKN